MNQNQLHAVSYYWHGGSSEEVWIEVRPDGSLHRKAENDGYRFLRLGPETTYTPITLPEVIGRSDMSNRVCHALDEFKAGRQPA